MIDGIAEESLSTTSTTAHVPLLPSLEEVEAPLDRRRSISIPIPLDRRLEVGGPEPDPDPLLLVPEEVG